MAKAYCWRRFLGTTALLLGACAGFGVGFTIVVTTDGSVWRNLLFLQAFPILSGMISWYIGRFLGARIDRHRAWRRR